MKMVTLNALGILDMSRHNWELDVIVVDLMRVTSIWVTHVTQNMKYCHRPFIIFLFIWYLYRHSLTWWKNAGPD